MLNKVELYYLRPGAAGDRLLAGGEPQIYGILKDTYIHNPGPVAYDELAPFFQERWGNVTEYRYSIIRSWGGMQTWKVLYDGAMVNDPDLAMRNLDEYIQELGAANRAWANIISENQRIHHLYRTINIDLDMEIQAKLTRWLHNNRGRARAEGHAIIYDNPQ